MKRYLTLFLFFLLIVNCFAENRLALVIGNSDYPKGSYLENPVHDADSVAKKLKGLNFDVIKITDCTLRDMNESIKDFAKKATNYDVALFFYAGHGMQSEGENYLIPIDAELETQADVKYNCTSLNYLLDKLDECGCPMKIIVLDACRNNPLARSWSRSMDKGLAIVNPPKGTFITFSTAAGKTALDGDGQNSPYTTAFLASLDKPNLTLFDFFNEVGRSVLTMTNNKQDPWANHSTMGGRFVFNENQGTESISILEEIKTQRDSLQHIRRQIITQRDSIQHITRQNISQRDSLQHITRQNSELLNELNTIKQHLEAEGKPLPKPESIFVDNNEAGKLKERLSCDVLKSVISLTISGDLNGTDFAYLYESVRRHLKHLDISMANILEGGDVYSTRWGYSTENNVIGVCLFEDYYELESICLPQNITSIRTNAFHFCSNLTSITIPSSVMSFGRNAFEHCPKLTKIYVENGNKVYDSRENCNAIIETSTNKLITGCTTTIIPNNVTEIEDHAFAGSGLTSITIPSNVTRIGFGSFWYCESLTSVALPGSLTSICDYAFWGCKNLTSVFSWAQNIFGGNDSFNEIPKNCTWHVPRGRIKEYKKHKWWVRKWKIFDDLE